MMNTSEEAETKAQTLEDLHLDRKKKKEDKAREKELKRLKALEKAKLKEQQESNSISRKSITKKNARRGDATGEENLEDYVDPETPFGEKKRLSPLMAKQYNPTLVEKSWYAWWEKSGFFMADAKSSKPPFVIVLPPPNVTGALHIGHALTAAIEDTIIRWKRMSGFNALWVPGVDHAGIATQVTLSLPLLENSGLAWSVCLVSQAPS
uniref:valine--tRNA ligase n=1 Tax=Rhizophora mucronata TaxID=61149 RepID=A0A2P2KHM3_RHIMU